MKKPKLAVNNLVTGALLTNGTSKEPATDDSSSETPTNASAIGKPATIEPTQTFRLLATHP